MGKKKKKLSSSQQQEQLKKAKALNEELINDMAPSPLFREFKYLINSLFNKVEKGDYRVLSIVEKMITQQIKSVEQKTAKIASLFERFKKESKQSFRSRFQSQSETSSLRTFPLGRKKKKPSLKSRVSGKSIQKPLKELVSDPPIKDITPPIKPALKPVSKAATKPRKKPIEPLPVKSKKSKKQTMPPLESTPVIRYSPVKEAKKIDISASSISKPTPTSAVNETPKIHIQASQKKSNSSKPIPKPKKAIVSKKESPKKKPELEKARQERQKRVQDYINTDQKRGQIDAGKN